jgi:hypothetical protein
MGGDLNSPRAGSRFCRGVAAAALATAGLLFVPGTEQALASPQACPTTNFYSVSNALGTFVPDTKKKVYGQAGVTLTVTAENGTEWSGTIGGSVEGDASFIIASAKATVDGSISYTKTTTVSLGGSWTVPSSQKLGWLALGSQGYVMSWQYGSNTAQCKYEEIRGGSATLPAMAPVVGHS